MKNKNILTQCYIDESIHESSGFVAIAFIFTSGYFQQEISNILKKAGLIPKQDEYKSRHRMDLNPEMQNVRGNLINLAASKTKIAIFFAPFNRRTLGKDCLQALQSTLLRNGINPSRLSIYFDENFFSSKSEAFRLHKLFHFLKSTQIYPEENSRLRLGIQVADAVAHCFGQILKEEITGKIKNINIGGEGTGYPEGTLAPLGWDLLMQLRKALMVRPVAYEGKYVVATDPIVFDPIHDDPTIYEQHPSLLGWGVQIAPESNEILRESVFRIFDRIWLGCIH